MASRHCCCLCLLGIVLAVLIAGLVALAVAVPLTMNKAESCFHADRLLPGEQGVCKATGDKYDRVAVKQSPAGGGVASYLFENGLPPLSKERRTRRVDNYTMSLRCNGRTYATFVFAPSSTVSYWVSSDVPVNVMFMTATNYSAWKRKKTYEAVFEDRDTKSVARQFTAPTDDVWITDVTCVSSSGSALVTYGSTAVYALWNLSNPTDTCVTEKCTFPSNESTVVITEIPLNATTDPNGFTVSIGEKIPKKKADLVTGLVLGIGGAVLLALMFLVVFGCCKVIRSKKGK